MNTYKITNITNLAPKRDRKFNSTISINYVDKMIKKTLNVNAGDTVFLTTHSLPLSVHRLRIKNLITVSEVSEAEVPKPKKKVVPVKKSKPKAVKKPIEEYTTKKKSTRTSSKKIDKLETEEKE